MRGTKEVSVPGSEGEQALALVAAALGIGPCSKAVRGNIDVKTTPL